MSDQVYVSGLKEFRKELRTLDPKFKKELREAHKEVSRFVESGVHREAGGGTAQQAKAAPKGVRAGATQTKATLKVGGARAPFAIGAFFGAKAYKQFPSWVGNQWTPGDGGGPYVISPFIRTHLDDVIDIFGDAVMDVAKRAFPERT